MKGDLFLITKPVAPPWDDGSKVLARDLAEYIEDRRVIVPTLKSPVYRPTNEKIEVAPIFDQTNGFYMNLRNKVRTLLYILKIPINSMAHIIVAPKSLSSHIIKLVLRVRGIKSIQTLSHSDIGAKSICSDNIVTLTHHTKKNLEKLGIDNIKVLPPAVDMNRLMTGGASEYTTNYKRMIYAGGFDDDATIAFFMNLIPRVLGIRDDVLFSFTVRLKTGRDIQNERVLRDFIHAEMFDTHCEFFNRVENMPELIRNSYLHVFPAEKYAGKVDIPIVLLETMALGIPIICSDAAPINEIKLSDPSCMIPAGNRDRFALKIEQFLADPAYYHRVSTSNRAQFEKYYSSDVISALYAKIYDEIEDQNPQ
jgi:phosphatidylinositol alpha-1,6-mannosyltransferase